MISVALGMLRPFKRVVLSPFSGAASVVSNNFFCALLSAVNHCGTLFSSPRLSPYVLPDIQSPCFCSVHCPPRRDCLSIAINLAPIVGLLAVSKPSDYSKKQRRHSNILKRALRMFMYRYVISSSIELQITIRG
jgi:hypothetical protein